MAGIYHNAELGVISMSSDGENWLTIADKNLGATQVYNDGDTLSEANSGKLYQWGNNHGFPYGQGQSVVNDTTQAGYYGPRLGYYESSTFITGNNNWDSSNNYQLRGGGTDGIEEKRGPCPEGFHIPSKTEWEGLKTIMDGLSLTGGNNWRINLHMPYSGFRWDSGEASSQNSIGRYWSATGGGSYAYEARFLGITSSEFIIYGGYRAYCYSIRPFKNMFVVPDSTWTIIQGVLGSAGIFWNQTDGIISITSDGTTGYTMADKNLGATTVYSDGDSLSEANCGKLYQWGNNYGFSYNGEITTSSTQVDASQYGPTVYYDSDIFRSQSYNSIYIWDRNYNQNLWGGNSSNVEDRQGPCLEGYRITNDTDHRSIHTVLTGLGLSISKDTYKTYLKIPLTGCITKLGAFSGYSNGSAFIWEADSGGNGKGRRFTFTGDTTWDWGGLDQTYALSIRPMKNEPIVPDYTWERLYGDEIPAPKKYIKRFQNSGNYYYFGDAPVHASGVTLNKSSLTLTEAGQTEQLVAIVTPSDAVEKSVTWTSSDTTVAVVYQDGTVECVNPGECTITCTVNDGGYTASCDVSNKKKIDFLLIGGGGGGAGGSGVGGGGAGGLIACNNYKISDGNYRIHIGYGGGGSQCNGNDGQCSIFGDFTAYGGGGGGYSNCNGCPGGSGGGGGLCCCGGGACSGQGYSGGNSSTCYCGGGGGGGGAGGYGGVGSTTCGGYGGAGKYSDISGQGQWYAGGGSGISVYGNSMPACNGGTDASNNACCYAKATICGAGGGAHSIQNTQYGGGGYGLFIVRYKTSCGYNITGGTCYTCGDYTIHCFEYTNSVYRQYLCIN